MNRLIELIREFEWNTLIILDACRYDYFNMLYSQYFEGYLKKVCSPTNKTLDFLELLLNKPLKVNYFACNPTIWLSNYKQVKKIINLADEAWDSSLNTVPATKANRIILTKYKHLLKQKCIIHYLQPHFPYIGKVKYPYLKKLTDGSASNVGQLKTLLRETQDLLVKAYKSNLEYILESLSNILRYFKRPLVITSDHGELLGEDNLYFHDYPIQFYHKKLREVPYYYSE